MKFPCQYQWYNSNSRQTNIVCGFISFAFSNMICFWYSVFHSILSILFWPSPIKPFSIALRIASFINLSKIFFEFILYRVSTVDDLNNIFLFTAVLYHDSFLLNTINSVPFVCYNKTQCAHQNLVLKIKAQTKWQTHLAKKESNWSLNVFKCNVSVKSTHRQTMTVCSTVNTYDKCTYFSRI